MYHIAAKRDIQSKLVRTPNPKWRGLEGPSELDLETARYGD